MSRSGCDRVLYQNGVGYFEREGLLAGRLLRLRARPAEVDDVLKTLTVTDRTTGRAIGTVVSVLGQDGNLVTIEVRLAPGPERRRLVVSHTLPSPAWRSTYRLLLGARAPESRLQGWAVINNTSGQSWRGAALTLASGAPLSFAVDLRSAHHVQRPTLQLADQTARLQGAVWSRRARSGDRDGDGIPDSVDKCPDHPETYNGYEDDDGCPDKGQVRVHRARILIIDKIYFGADSARVSELSTPVVKAIAATLIGNPDLRVEVQGHATSSERSGWELSLRRAQAVLEALVAAGVPRTRLHTRAYGATATIAGRDPSVSRRVELAVLKPTAASGAAAPKPSPGAAAYSVAGLVRYDLRGPITIHAGVPTLVATLERQLTSQEVLLYDPAQPVRGGSVYPLRAAHIEGAGRLTLEPGPVAVFARGSYVGEGMLSRLEPGEAAFIPYAVELGTRVSTEQRSARRPARLVAAADGVITVEDHALEVTRYTISAGLAAPSQLYLRHVPRAGHVLEAPPKGSHRTGSAWLLPVTLLRGREASLVVTERRVERRSVQIADVDSDMARRLALYLDGNAPPHLVRGVKDVVGQQRKVADHQERVGLLERQLADLGERASDLRQSLKAIERSSGATALRRELLGRLSSLLKRIDAIGQALATARLAHAEARTLMRAALRRLQRTRPAS